MLDRSWSPMMFGFGRRAGFPSRPVDGVHAHSPRAARRSAPTKNLLVIYVSLNTYGGSAPVLKNKDGDPLSRRAGVERRKLLAKGVLL
jgi:hypothetical protein